MTQETINFHTASTSSATQESVNDLIEIEGIVNHKLSKNFLTFD